MHHGVLQLPEQWMLGCHGDADMETPFSIHTSPERKQRSSTVILKLFHGNHHGQ